MEPEPTAKLERPGPDQRPRACAILGAMSCTCFAFAAAPFEQGAHPLEQKKVARDRPVGLLRFAPGFADANWCTRAHAIYVLQGTLELELRDRVQPVPAGDACWLDAGTEHRARTAGDE